MDRKKIIKICADRPVVTDFRFTKKATTKIRTTGDARIKWWKAREQSSEQACKDIVKAIPEINPTASAADNWQQCADAVRKVASEKFGRTKPGTSRIKKETWWWTNEVEAAIKSKKEAFKQWRQTRTQQDKDVYNLRKKEAKIQIAIAKQEHFEDLYRRLETRQGESEIYRIAKARHAKTRDIGNISWTDGGSTTKRYPQLNSPIQESLEEHPTSDLCLGSLK
ncbi:hypothetical protein WR25_25558 [Diploscapter pachys]|uniref:Uncharacterized protein n=1 Tax=Diploscapter pachys TaxID=2018661 RepID=A0A2A2LTE9_9BILA|nr:hypothetical protein WR25_25558 [Diploscapter pachys]